MREDKEVVVRKVILLLLLNKFSIVRRKEVENDHYRRTYGKSNTKIYLQKCRGKPRYKQTELDFVLAG